MGERDTGSVEVMGGVAQLGERDTGSVEVMSSSLTVSMKKIPEML